MSATSFCIVLSCCCILAATSLPPDCRYLCDRRLGIRVSSYSMTLPRQLCTESNYTPLAIEVRVRGPSPELRCLSMARTSRSISPKGTTRNHASLKMGLRRPGARSSNFCGRKPLLTTKKQRGQRLENHIKPIIKPIGKTHKTVKTEPFLQENKRSPVSYTHLTLPTILRV